MNKARRAEIAKAQELLANAREAMEEAKSLIETAKDEEREYHDNMPDSLKEGEKGSQADAAATALEEVFEALEGLDFDIIDSQLEEAQL